MNVFVVGMGEMVKREDGWGNGGGEGMDVCVELGGQTRQA